MKFWLCELYASSVYVNTPIHSTSAHPREIPSNNVLFREIHKNAWLRRLPNHDKRSGISTKKNEKVWTVFCVHDDIHPFLEFYISQEAAMEHKPNWFICLNTTLHVSPTIIAQDQECEFVVTLPSEVVRLAAPSWDSMMEWVDVIRSKLREMKILSPQENVYSRMPEARLPLLPTRDPNSPLPPPPTGPSALVPGVEPVHMDPVESIAATPRSPSAETTSNSVTILPAANARLANESTSGSGAAGGNGSGSRRDGQPRSEYSGSTLGVRGSPSSSNATSGPVPVVGPIPVPTVVASTSSAIPQDLPTTLVNPSCSNMHWNTVSSTYVNPSAQRTSPGPSQSSNPSATETAAPAPVSAPAPAPINPENVTVIEVSVASTQQYNTPCDIFNFNFVRDTLPTDPETRATCTSNAPSSPNIHHASTSAESPRDRDRDRDRTRSRAPTVVTPSTPGTTSRPVVSPQPCSNATPLSSPPRLWQQITQAVSNVISRSEPVRVTQSVTNITIASESAMEPTTSAAAPSSSIYEQVFPNSSSLPDHLPEETRHRPVLPVLSSPPAPLGQLPHIELPRRRRRTSSGSEAANPRNSSRTRQPPQQQFVQAERPLRPAPHPFRHAPDNVDMLVGSGSGSRATLREQQVVQLRREMLHPGGVRMQLRRKDCVNSIALVDAFGAVWVAGWKQREYPMLYNALHIGDQLVSTAGIPVPNSAEAQRIIRSCTNSLYVELVIRRLPFGRVFALRREVDGQSLGINLEGGSGEIRDVVANSPAGRAGLTSRAPTCDGLSLTSWVLTEVNGRPLNLFFKDGEVRDRLNAVGTDISILVQPLDLIKQIRKQLRAIRGHKDYIVQ